MRKWLFPLAFCILLPTAGGAVLSVRKDRDVVLSLPTVPTAVVILKKNGDDLRVTVDKPNLVQAMVSGNVIYLTSTSVTNSGSVILTVKSGADAERLVFPVELFSGDSDRDGYPDIVEFGDGSGAGNSFRDWFCVIAESQYYQPSDIWYDVHKDCAGLIEFAYREALKLHDKAWARNYRFLTDVNRDDGRGYYYPQVPLIGKRIFRVKGGVFDPDQVQKDFAPGASGSVIRMNCMKLVSRNVKDAKSGDVLFYFHDDNLKMPSHAMIYVKEKDSSDPLDGYLIYHTGPGYTNSGLMKKVLLRDMLRHPDPSWRPSEANTFFLGVYKWKILN